MSELPASPGAGTGQGFAGHGAGPWGVCGPGGLWGTWVGSGVGTQEKQRRMVPRPSWPSSHPEERLWGSESRGAGAGVSGGGKAEARTPQGSGGGGNRERPEQRREQGWTEVGEVRRRTPGSFKGGHDPPTAPQPAGTDPSLWPSVGPPHTSLATSEEMAPQPFTEPSPAPGTRVPSPVHAPSSLRPPHVRGVIGPRPHSEAGAEAGTRQRGRAQTLPRRPLCGDGEGARRGAEVLPVREGESARGGRVTHPPPGDCPARTLHFWAEEGPARGQPEPGGRKPCTAHKELLRTQEGPWSWSPRPHWGSEGGRLA